MKWAALIIGLSFTACTNLNKTGNESQSIDINRHTSSHDQFICKYQVAFSDPSNSDKDWLHGKYEWTGNFKKGYARVLYSGKWGFIDQKGQVFIAPQYDWAFDFSHDYANIGSARIMTKLKAPFALVIKKKSYFFINTEGERVSRFWLLNSDKVPSLKNSEPLAQIHDPYLNRAIVYIASKSKKRNFWTILDENEEPIIPPPQAFSNGFLAVKFKSNGKFGHLKLVCGKISSFM